MKYDVAQMVTDKIIAAMERGTAPWSPEWQGVNAKLHMPRRANGEYYRGINVLMLWITAHECAYSADQWMTYKQAKDLGGQVRKGEKGAPVIKYGTFEKERDNGEKDSIPFLKSYSVFNVQQIDGLPAEYYPADALQIDTGARSIPALEAFYGSRPARVLNDGTQPRYVPSTDAIHMPHVQQFETAESYYGTLAHEMIHWTGHKSRLDRFAKFSRREDYAFEELIAELGACFVTARVGGDRGTDRSAAYIGAWLEALRNDKKYIFKAAARAAEATDYLIDAAPCAASAAAA
jgi:antirestriction protein ArdC